MKICLEGKATCFPHPLPREIREPLVQRRRWNRIAGFSRIPRLSFVIDRAYEKIDELLLRVMTVTDTKS